MHTTLVEAKRINNIAFQLRKYTHFYDVEGKSKPKRYVGKMYWNPSDSLAIFIVIVIDYWLLSSLYRTFHSSEFEILKNFEIDWTFRKICWSKISFLVCNAQKSSLEKSCQIQHQITKTNRIFIDFNVRYMSCSCFW